MTIKTTVAFVTAIAAKYNANQIYIRQYVLTIMPYINQECVDGINL